MYEISSKRKAQNSGSSKKRRVKLSYEFIEKGKGIDLIKDNLGSKESKSSSWWILHWISGTIVGKLYFSWNLFQLGFSSVTMVIRVYNFSCNALIVIVNYFWGNPWVLDLCWDFIWFLFLLHLQGNPIVGQGLCPPWKTQYK